MEWERIRAAYVAAFEAKGWSKAKVARAGGLADANALHKLMRNRNRGPEVETFVRAVEGLGLSVSTFFATLEPPTSLGDVHAASSAPGRRPPLSQSDFEDVVARTFTFLTRLLESRGIGGIVADYRDPNGPARPSKSGSRRPHRRKTRPAA